MNWSLIIPAAGTGSRFGADAPKQFLPLRGRPLICHTIECFLNEPDLQQVVVAASKPHRQWFDALVLELSWQDRVRSVEGGKTRQESVLLAARTLPATNLLVAVHDAVRPFVRSPVVHAALKGAEHVGASVVAVPLSDTIHRVADRMIVDTPLREHYMAAQTPQCFRVEILMEILENAARDGIEATDEAGLAVHYGHAVRVVEGDPSNFKITRPEDWTIAEANFEQWRKG